VVGNSEQQASGGRSSALGARACGLLVVLSLAACGPAPHPTTVLSVDEGLISAGQTLTVTSTLPAATDLLVRLEQGGADLRLAVSGGPDGGPSVGPIDNGLFRDGDELLQIRVTVDTPVTFIISAGEDVAADASYRLSLIVLPAEGAPDQTRIAGLAALTRAGEALAIGTEVSRTAAEAELEAALVAFDEGGLEPLAAATTYRLAMLRYAWFYRWDASAEQFAEAARRYRGLGAARLAAQATLWHGAALVEARELQRARTAIDAAHAELVAIGAEYDAAFAVNMQGYLATKAGRYADSIADYRSARDAFEAMGETLRVSQAQTNLALDLMRSGRLHEAVDEIERAVGLLSGSGESRQLADELLNLAWVRMRTGELAGARAAYLEARSLFREIDDASGELYTTNGLALTYAQAGDTAQAARLLDEVAAGARAQDDHDLELTSLTLGGKLLRQRGDLPGARSRHTELLRSARTDLERARAQLELGRDEMAGGDAAAALARYAQAELQLASVEVAPYLSLSLDLRVGVALMRSAETSDLSAARARLERAVATATALDRPAVEIRALQALARLDAAGGDHVAALRTSERALVLLRDLRAQVPGGHLRWSYSGAQQPRYAEQIALLMELASDADDAARTRLEARALEVSDESHALALAEFIEGGSGPSDAAIALRQQLTELRVALDELDPTADDEREQIQAQIREGLLALDRTWEASDWPVRRQGIRVAEIQALLAGEDAPPATLVEFSLGDPVSYAWVVTSDSVRALRLPPRATIERAAYAAFSALSRRHEGGGTAVAPTLTTLSDLVIDAFDGVAQDGIVLVVADGALDLVPFDALPHPAGGALVDRAEVLRIPSATILSLLGGDRVGSVGLLAFADPVGEVTDATVRELSRLPAAVDEVESVVALARERGLTATARIGVEADLAALRAAAPSTAILHLATHGVLDLEDPRASGLVLADAGRRRLVGPDDLLRLDLAAQLVVLSACDASRGSVTGGAGAMSLAQSFLAAGAPRVVSTLWQVEDASAQTLMAAFYRHLFDGLRPSAALRQAKLDLRIAGGPGSEVSQWAAFEFIGVRTALPELR
jgi:CHAT domain-containing protein